MIPRIHRIGPGIVVGARIAEIADGLAGGCP